jgi:hypothetical protein
MADLPGTSIHRGLPHPPGQPERLLVPLPADWVSPTVGHVPPGGVAPGERPVHLGYDEPAPVYLAPVGTPPPSSLPPRGPWKRIGSHDGWLWRALDRLFGRAA